MDKERFLQGAVTVDSGSRRPCPGPTYANFVAAYRPPQQTPAL